MSADVREHPGPALEGRGFARESTPPSTRVVYSRDAFEKAMGHHFNDKDDQAMEYESNGSNYRTWCLDDAPPYGGAGLISAL